jgi:hypothetical protein
MRRPTGRRRAAAKRDVTSIPRTRSSSSAQTHDHRDGQGRLQARLGARSFTRQMILWQMILCAPQSKSRSMPPASTPVSDARYATEVSGLPGCRELSEGHPRESPCGGQPRPLPQSSTVRTSLPGVSDRWPSRR